MSLAQNASVAAAAVSDWMVTSMPIFFRASTKMSAIDSRDRRVYSSNPYGPTVTNPTNWAEQATWDDTGARATGETVSEMAAISVQNSLSMR